MRASAPSLAISEKPYYEPPSASSNDLLTAISLGIDDADSHGLLSNRLASSSTTPAAHFPISNLLTLPNSFGTLFLGETFRTYLCVRNESSTAVREPSLRVEMQVGASEEAGRWHQLAHVILPTPTRYSPNPEGEDDQGTPRWELDPGSALETSLGYDIKDLGPHVLVCTVGYKSPHTQPDGQVTWVERNFRKFYKFSVDRSPISVRTKVHQPRYASSLHHPEGKVRDRVELEVQVQNVGASEAGLVLNGLTLKPAPGWEWESVDRPEGDEGMWIQSGSNEILADGDVRQYLFRLMPEKEVVLTEEVLKGGIDLGMSAEGLVMRGDPLGHLDISWRMALGEPGRLQTSQLVRRRVVSPPVVVDSGTASQGTFSLNPRLKTRLTLQPRTLEKLREVKPGDLMDLDLDVAVCDVSGLLLPPLQKGPSKEAVQKTPELQQHQDDDDDDTPLSEIASSPRTAIKRNPMDSTTSSTVNANLPPPSSTETVVIRRTLHLALQHCSIDPPPPPRTTSQPDTSSSSTTTVAASEHPSTPRKTPVPSRTSTPTQSSSGGVSALNKARLQANLSSLVRNSSLSSLRPRASVDEEAGGNKSSSTPPALPPKSSDIAGENVGVQVSTEKDPAPERKVLPPPHISSTTVARLYRAYLETHSQALNRPPPTTTVIPATFLPSPTTTPLGSTLLPLPPVTFDISVLSSGSTLYRSDQRDGGETRLPVKLRYAIDEVESDDGVVRFGAVRVVLLAYSDVVVDADGVEGEADGVRECMTVIEEVPVIAEAVILAH
ncbi:hypothetical protein PHSY_000819 [Pseudozyma hubeiensis SY62]|uniref:Uncharacterized protein n=1 Tax=Pseudozyma hubeiensis (strain SY62) TaxID=1305764 RepID=R9P574_PSEHS|nr:hypothetical protein PHSY_000819 [Pseudozyma hubeiensis SY62]GAC93255.1 hypothetical protein PHSY_000819 [Pseudozyma hubeiensis SY62]